MASPQLENGYVRIANEVLEALIRYRIPGEQMQCVLCVIRKTWGYGKKKDRIPISQFYEYTKIKKPNIIRALKELIKKNVIKKDNEMPPSYWFNKNYDTWKTLSKKIIVIKKDKKSYQKRYPQKTKENSTSKEVHFDKEKIQESAKQKIESDLNMVCEKLYAENIFPEVYKFKNLCLKKYNSRALLHTLVRCYTKRDFDGGSPWAYCIKIIKVENGNYNERDYQKDTPKRI
jgi:phage replication O-like protein O